MLDHVIRILQPIASKQVQTEKTPYSYSAKQRALSVEHEDSMRFVPTTMRIAKSNFRIDARAHAVGFTCIVGAQYASRERAAPGRPSKFIKRH
jgi:hypothetical protein